MASASAAAGFYIISFVSVYEVRENNLNGLERLSSVPAGESHSQADHNNK
jgi:hypothetical protein